MQVKIVYELEFGEKRCSVEKNKHCQFLGATSFGTKPVCMFFRDERTKHGFVNLFEDDDGWVLRCHSCRSALAADRDTYIVNPLTKDITDGLEGKEDRSVPR